VASVAQLIELSTNRVNDRLRRISEVVGSGQGDIKKGLKIEFIGEEGIDAGGLRKEWFLLLIREAFDEAHGTYVNSVWCSPVELLVGLFVYDEDSRFCYFNPHCFESSEQYFLVGVVTGLAIYNSTILDIAFPPFVFKKLLASTPVTTNVTTSTPRLTHGHSLEDLAELRPALARGLRQLLEYDGDVQETFCRDFVVEEDRYGENSQV
jgi:E3 ubiquitin-protein ligase HECTD2